MSAFFVCLEGLDCAGKTTQIERLVKRLETEGNDVVQARSPGGTLIGEIIRQIVLGDDSMDNLTELFLHVACRAELYQTVIRDVLALGDDSVMVMSRFFDSLIAYQGKGRGFDIPTIYGLKAIICDTWNPDLTILLDIPVEDSMRRMSERGGPSDKMEREDKRFYTRVRSQFLEIAKSHSDRYFVIDAMIGADEIERRIWNVVERGIEKRCTMMKGGGRESKKESKKEWSIQELRSQLGNS